MRLKPEHLKHRPGQKLVEVPDDVAGVFGPMGSVRLAVAPTTNRASVLSGAPTLPHRGASAGQRESAADPIIQRDLPDSGSPVISLAHLPQPSLLPDTRSCAPEKQSLRGQTDLLRVPLSKVAARWPEAVRAALARVIRDESTLQIPLAELEPGIKRGKLCFAWNQLRFWIVPALSTPLSEYDTLQLELPLIEIVPTFIARRGSAQIKAKSPVPSSIPDLFSASPRADGKAEANRSIPETGFKIVAPEPKVLCKPAPSCAMSSPATAVSSSSTTSTCVAVEKQALSPAETIANVFDLPGVSGALIASHDGLSVVAKLPPGLSNEAVAAFLPPMYERLRQYTHELKLGEPAQIVVVVENRPLAIFKAGDLFLTVLGRAGEPLPEVQLKAMIAHLSRAK